MCVTVLANLTHNARTKRASSAVNESDDNDQELIFLNLENEIIPYFNAQWENLTSMSRRLVVNYNTSMRLRLPISFICIRLIIVGDCLCHVSRSIGGNSSPLIC